ncbi:hypothetical protein [Negadavirga shengliensis]|uniref:DUF4825 domain-containing protein n=1 Tax=Negadavirga shengliensis TaxID=1389218 RepID=A0ABV9T8B0_9BACT
MRKIISILLLACFLVYHFGYYVFYFSYQHVIESDWTSKVYKKDFQDYQVMKIPMKLPYSFEEEGFQLTNIPFKKDGKSYRAIKKRFADDTFELLYVPDMAKIKLEFNLKQWVISLVPESNAENQQERILTQNFIKDYLYPKLVLIFETSGFNQAVFQDVLPVFFKTVSLKLPSPPPKTKMIDFLG